MLLASLYGNGLYWWSVIIRLRDPEAQDLLRKEQIREYELR
jgi:hypothetical protein